MVFLLYESFLDVNSKQRELWKCSKEDPPSCSQATPPKFSGFSNPSAAPNPAFPLSTSSSLQGAPSLRLPPPCLYFLLDSSGSLLQTLTLRNTPAVAAS